MGNKDLYFYWEKLAEFLSPGSRAIEFLENIQMSPNAMDCGETSRPANLPTWEELFTDNSSQQNIQHSRYYEGFNTSLRHLERNELPPEVFFNGQFIGYLNGRLVSNQAPTSRTYKVLLECPVMGHGRNLLTMGPETMVLAFHIQAGFSKQK